jgi:hypothetical protein
MPIIGAIVGAVVTGLFYWLLWGGGLQYIDARLQQSRDRKRDAERRAAAIENQRMAPLRSISDARDAAVLLMLLVAGERGVPTPEQLEAIGREMRDVLGFGAELDGRLAYAKFAAEQALSAQDAVDALVPLFRCTLSADERQDLFDMLRRVAEVHGGPIPLQERVIERVERRLSEAQ